MRQKKILFPGNALNPSLIEPNLGRRLNNDGLVQQISSLFNELVFQPLARFFAGLEQDNWTVLIALIAGAIACGYSLGRSWTFLAGRSRRFQNASEALVSRTVMQEFVPPDYHLMNHVTLQLGDGTTEIDHILVSRFGVFVIETKHYKGWIFANKEHKTWTQVLYRLKYKFQNPIHQNSRHVRAVRDLLDILSVGDVRSIVVFTGSAEFKTEVPPGVYRLHEMVKYLRAQTEVVMSENRLQFCVGRLETARLTISETTDVEHVDSLHRRHGN